MQLLDSESLLKSTSIYRLFEREIFVDDLRKISWYKNLVETDAQFLRTRKFISNPDSIIDDVSSK
jgi:hypothetical protein